MAIRATLLPLVLTSMLIFACREPAAPRAFPRTIGLVTGASGPTAAWGEAIRRGAEIAVRECNGLAPRGALWSLAVEDDGGRPEQTAAAVQKLAGDPAVLAIIGADTSSGSLAAAPIVERERIVMITPTASAPAVTKGRRFFFRVCATDELEARTAARLAVERIGAKRFAILRDTRNDYSVGLATIFTAEVGRLGGAVVASLDYAAGDHEFRPQITAALAKKPDLLFIPGYYGDVAQIARQFRDLGGHVPIAGGSGWDSPKLIELGGAAVEGGWFVSGMRSASPLFVDAFRRQFGVTPDAASAQAHDAVGLVCRAADGLGDSPRGSLRDRVAAIREFPGASGTITIGADQNARKPLAVFQIVNGAFVERESLAAR